MRLRRYADRREAGRVLAGQLSPLELPSPVLVLALPRGGVPVGVEVAQALRAPLALLLVRKLGAPRHAELAMGAVALAGGHTTVYRNPEIVAGLAVPEEAFARALADAEQELRSRAARWPVAAGDPEVRGSTAVVVDDGLATGATMLAAVQALRGLGPARVVAAAPVGSLAAVRLVKRAADVVVCPLLPRAFSAVGASYTDFRQVPDDEVGRLLGESGAGTDG